MPFKGEIKDSSVLQLSCSSYLAASLGGRGQANVQLIHRHAGESAQPLPSGSL